MEAKWKVDERYREAPTRAVKGLGSILYRLAAEADQAGDHGMMEHLSGAHDELIAWRKKWFET